MREPDVIWDESVDKVPFYGATIGEAWYDANCLGCKHDEAYRNGAAEESCPLLIVAYVGRTPAEWKPDPDRRFVCTEFQAVNP